MSDLVRSGLPRPVYVTGAGGRERLVLVRPPTVAEALELYARLEGIQKDDELDREQFYRLLRQWMPPSVALFLTSKSCELPTAVDYVTAFLDEGLPRQDPTEGDDEDQDKNILTFEDINSLPWTLSIGEVCAAFFISFEAVMAMPWPRFMLLLADSDAVMSRRRYLYDIPVAMLPYVESEAAQETLELFRRSSRISEKKKPEDPEVPVDLDEQIGRLQSKIIMGRSAGSVAKQDLVEELRALLKLKHQHAC